MLKKSKNMGEEREKGQAPFLKSWKKNFLKKNRNSEEKKRRPKKNKGGRLRNHLGRDLKTLPHLKTTQIKQKIFFFKNLWVL